MVDDTTSQPPANPATSKPEKPKSSWFKRLLKIGGLVIGAILIYWVIYISYMLFLGYYPSKLPKDTGQWLTYRNEEYGFEFQYPEILTIEEERADSGFEVRVTLPSIHRWNRNRPKFSGGVKYDALSVSVWNVETQARKQNTGYKSGEDVIVDNVPSKKLATPSYPTITEESDSYTVFVLFPNREYQLTVRHDKFGPEFTGYFHTLVDSFKFTKPQE